MSELTLLLAEINDVLNDIPKMFKDFLLSSKTAQNNFKELKTCFTSGSKSYFVVTSSKGNFILVKSVGGQAVSHW